MTAKPNVQWVKQSLQAMLLALYIYLVVFYSRVLSLIQQLVLSYHDLNLDTYFGYLLWLLTWLNPFSFLETNSH